jgi:hypothetical protein
MNFLQTLLEWLRRVLNGGMLAAQAQRVTVLPTPERFSQPVGVPDNLVRRRARTLWQERGWRKDGQRLVGYYRTRFGACRGEIVERYLGRADFYIFNPPEGLQRHSHAPCFHSQGRGKYQVHFSKEARTPDEGIMAIEQILTQAYRL